MKKLPMALAVLLLIFHVSTFAQPNQSTRLETVQLQSKLAGATLPYNVILPFDYEASSTTRYPVLYLLHGLTGHYTDWVTKTNVADYAGHLPLIIVMPEGNNGWYTDSATVSADKYETYILQDLIPDVQRRYRTIEDRSGRAIAGLSMGGYGAIKFGLKSPGTFAFAASMSGAVNATVWNESNIKDAGALRDSVTAVFGPTDSPARKANDVMQLVRDLPAAKIPALPYFYLDCGTEDGLIDHNEQLAALLRERKIPHEFRELPGVHNWVYWDTQVREVLRLATQKLRMPPVRPPGPPMPPVPMRAHPG
jgi:S-formylglutathione hydrolase FrmB